MKYFTKEYIKECDCEEIQEIVIKRGWKRGDWFTRPTFGKKIFLITSDKDWKFNDEIWLPLDQLNEEIEKICKKYGYWYRFEYYESNLVTIGEKDSFILTKEIAHTNPYIAKIKLLKQLLKQKG